MAKAKGEAAHGERDIDALFHLPLAEFTAARNALAARLKKAGQTEEADRIKTLPKPSIAAWVVNQLHFNHRAAFDRLIAAGEKFRTAQAAHLSGKPADIRAPLEARRAALAELSGHAAATLRQAGSSATPEMMRRVTTTLEALSTYAGLPDTPRAGRLTDDVDPPGFETLAALVPRLGKSGHAAGPTRVIPFQARTRTRAAAKSKAKPSAKSSEEDRRREAEEHKAQLAAAKAAVQQAERDLREARKDAQRAEEALKKAAARAKDAEAAKKKAEEELEKAAADADAARKHARSVAAGAEEAAQAVEDAERALDVAQRALREVAG